MDLCGFPSDVFTLAELQSSQITRKGEIPCPSDPPFRYSACPRVLAGAVPIDLGGGWRPSLVAGSSRPQTATPDAPAVAIGGDADQAGKLVFMDEMHPNNEPSAWLAAMTNVVLEPVGMG